MVWGLLEGGRARLNGLTTELLKDVLCYFILVCLLIFVFYLLFFIYLSFFLLHYFCFFLCFQYFFFFCFVISFSFFFSACYCLLFPNCYYFLFQLEFVLSFLFSFFQIPSQLSHSLFYDELLIFHDKSCIHGMPTFMRTTRTFWARGSINSQPRTRAEGDMMMLKSN